jgi:hypothetical protein
MKRARDEIHCRWFMLVLYCCQQNDEGYEKGKLVSQGMPYFLTRGV